MRNLLSPTAAIVLFLSTLSFGQSVYKQVATYPLPGDGGWDYLTYDTTGDRLFIARGTSILVVDPQGKQLGEIPAQGAHGIALVPEKNLGFSSNGKANTVTVFDLKTLKPIQDINVGEGPDSIIYDSYSKHVIVMNGRGKSLMAIDPDTRQVQATVPLGARLESAAAAPGKVYVDLEDTNELAVVDTKTWKADRWKLEGCEGPTGLAIDENSGTLFTTCGNAKMLVLDGKSGKVLATLKTGDGTDAAAFDAGYAFAPNGEGTLTVVGKSGGSYTVMENVPTMKSARTMTVDPKSHKVFLVGAEFNPPAPGQRRGTMKPGTFRLLVFAPAT